jgi:hypothetical protein
LSEQALQTLFTHSGVLPPQLPPQETKPPQPLAIVSQSRPAGQEVSGVQPQTFACDGVPPVHVSGSVQLPQLIVPSQPSAIVPQLSPVGQVVSRVQPQIPAAPPPPQVTPAPLQAVQFPPPVPQAVSSSTWHCPDPSQQPFGQLVASQTQTPSRQRRFVPQRLPLQAQVPSDWQIWPADPHGCPA